MIRIIFLNVISPIQIESILGISDDTQPFLAEPPRGSDWTLRRAVSGPKD